MMNLIQIIQKEKGRFRGTIQDNQMFPFHIVDVQEGTYRIHKNRPVIQAYGTRANYVARTANVQASVLRHGGGKVRAARIATNLVECTNDTWVCKTRGQLRRTPHAEVPPALPPNSSLSQQLAHEWALWESGIYAMCNDQRLA